MNEKEAKQIGEEIRDLLADIDKRIIKAEIDGSAGPNKFTLTYADDEDEVAEITVRLPRPEKWR